MQTNAASMENTLALLGKLKEEMPEIWGRAQVVGRWVWLEFSTAPRQEIRDKLKDFGFHWNRERKCWQHPCGVKRGHSSRDPRGVYPSIPASAIVIKEDSGQPKQTIAKEFKVISLRECPLPQQMAI